MNQRAGLCILGILLLSFTQLGMSRDPQQYDEEAREAERQEKIRRKKGSVPSPAEAAKNFASGVKEATVDSATGLFSETAESTQEDLPVVGTLEGARQGTEAVLDSTVKGAFKVATLGYGEVDQYDVEEPEAGSGEPTKIKIKIPGT